MRDFLFAFYWALDVGFSIVAIYLILNGELTNALLCWVISELYSIQRKMRYG